jgi:DNA-binding transcriptional MerR regulator
MLFDLHQIPGRRAGYAADTPASELQGFLVAMTVIEVEAATGVSAHAVRWYVRKGLLRPRRNARNGYYEFGVVDMCELAFIARAKRLGFTLTELRRILEQSRRLESPCPEVRDIVKKRVAEVGAQIEALAGMERHMRRALRLWRRMPDGIPTGGEVCRLIDALGDGVDLRAARRLKMQRAAVPARRQKGRNP